MEHLTRVSIMFQSSEGRARGRRRLMGAPRSELFCHLTRRHKAVDLTPLSPLHSSSDSARDNQSQFRRFLRALTIRSRTRFLFLSLSAATEYGRTCKDIGCLPREVCVMAYESCSFNQQENVSCGRYPTCKKNQDGQAMQQNAGN